MRISNSRISNILGLNCGIYKITNSVNKKCYIGSSKNIAKRVRTHKIELREGRHHSSKLQNSYNLHGKDCFSFDILELCDVENLEGAESFWIKYFDAFHSGYNGTDGVGAPWRGKAMPLSIKQRQNCKPVKILNPEGQIVEWYSISDFCKNYNLHVGALALIRGRVKSLKGWKIYVE